MCTKNCGCRKKKLSCHSGCACNGNCGEWGYIWVDKLIRIDGDKVRIVFELIKI
jgi:hypothetical protein